jgi:hypothetical protein
MIKWNEVTPLSKWLAIIFFLLVLPILSFFIGMQYQQVSLNQEKYNISANVPTPNPNEKLTYRNEKIGIEFQYPSTWNGITEEVEKGCFDYDKGYATTSEPCEKIYLAHSAISELFNLSPNPRGPGYDDYFWKGEVSKIDFCKDKANNCLVLRNSNDVEISKITINAPEYDDECIEGCFPDRVMFYIKNIGSDYPVIIFSTTNDEKTLNQIVDSLKFI